MALCLATIILGCVPQKLPSTSEENTSSFQEIIQEPTISTNPNPSLNVPRRSGTAPPATFTPIPVLTNDKSLSDYLCLSNGKIVFGSFSSNIADDSLPYRIYLPPCYGEDDRLYPALYLLHGGSHDERHWDDLGVDEVVEAGIKDHQLPPMLIVLPGSGSLANTTSGGPYSYEAVILNELIPHIEANYCASSISDFRAIGGISRGGYWALEIAFRHPDKFKSVGGHSAALLDTYAGPQINPQYTGVTNDLLSLRIFLDIGKDDWVIHNIRQLHEDLQAVGREHTWALNEGAHEDVYWKAHMKEYVEWYSDPWPRDRTAYSKCKLEN